MMTCACACACHDAAGKAAGSLPVELRRFEEAYHIQAWALQGKVQQRPTKGDATVAPPEVAYSPPLPRQRLLFLAPPHAFPFNVDTPLHTLGARERQQGLEGR